MKICYSRPLKLSDPFGDFMSEEDREFLRGIIRKSDDTLGWEELSCIFQGILPAGTYEECAYFIPWALKFMASGDDAASSLVDEFCRWCDENIESLKNDLLWNEILGFFIKLFVDCTGKLVLYRNGDGVLYPENLDIAETVLECFDSMKRIDTGIAPFLSLLCENMDYPKAVWTLTLSRYTLAGCQRQAYDIVMENICDSSNPDELEYQDKLLRYSNF